MPLQGSEYAKSVDLLYEFIFWLGVVFFIGIVGSMAYFVFKYKRVGEPRNIPQFSHNFALEVTWSVIPLIIVIVIFFWGFDSYMSNRIAPNDSLEIKVYAKKWQWEFEYPDGTRTLGEFHVPKDKPVKLIMSSDDVIHSFFLPTMRQKMDVLPGRYTTLWFQPTVEGKHQVFCTEYCGDGHSEMMAELTVDSQDKYKEWIENGGLDKDTPLDQLGARLYKSRNCNTCHSIDGTRIQGPTFKGIWGRTERITGGTTVVVDENYVRESVMDPNAKVVEGYERGVMPTYKGLLKDREVNAIIEYMKTLK